MQHKDITDAELHQVKGAASATIGQVLEALGDGTAEFVTRLFVVTASLTPTAVSAHSTSEQAFTVSGVLVASDRVVVVEKAAFQSGLSTPHAIVTANNQITLQFGNFTNASITPTAGESYSFLIYRE